MLLIAIATVLSAISSDMPLGSNVPGVSWLTVNKCSINSLHMYLKLHSLTVNYPAIESGLSISSKGCRFEDMGLLANRLGMKSSIVRLTPQTMADYELPMIAHLETADVNTGHYVVVLGVRDADVDLIDGTSGARMDVPKVEFYKKWTGYALVKTPLRGSVAAVLFLAGLCILAAEIARALAKAKHVRKLIRKAALPSCLIIISLRPSLACGQDLVKLAADVEAQWSNVSQFEVKYTLTMKALADNEQIHKVLGVNHLLKADRIYAFKENKRYFEQSDAATPLSPTPGSVLSGVLRKNNVYTYNGESPIIRYMNTLSKIFTTTSLDNPAYSSDRRIFDQEFLGLLYHAVPNIFVPRRPSAVSAPSLSDKLRAGAFRFMGNESLDGDSCIKLQEDGEHAIEVVWLSPALQFAVVKRETRKNGVDHPASVTLLRKHRRVTPQLQIPFLITTNQYYDVGKSSEYPRSPLIQQIVAVKECVTKGLPDSMFLYEPPPGTPALGDVDGNRVSYRVPANQQQLDTILDEMKSREEASTLRKGHAPLLIGIAFLGVCLAIPAVLYFRFRRRSTL